MANLDASQIKEKAEELAKKIGSDSSLLEKFKGNPANTVKSLIKEKLSGDIIEKIVEIIKTKLKLDDAKGILSSIKGIFGGK
ncbi:MAG: hypothetical protein IKI41_03895 [Clostridia bacterium]|nr:hypothetical protein [Clostridia bacterium]